MEIAIVMVIIGLLIGGILKAQGMIQNAKVKRVVKQADELRAAVMGFYDKYGMYPGDENQAAIPPGADGEGNGDGMINTNAEIFEVYRDLVRSELIAGDYNGTTELPSMPLGARYVCSGLIRAQGRPNTISCTPIYPPRCVWRSIRNSITVPGIQAQSSAVRLIRQEQRYPGSIFFFNGAFKCGPAFAGPSF